MFVEKKEILDGFLPEMFHNTGFADGEETAQYTTINGTLSI